MNKKIIKKLIIRAIAILSLFILCLTTEIILFNNSYWTMPKDQRGIHNIDTSEITYHDVEKKGDLYLVTGNDPYFIINDNRYISYINLTFRFNENKNSFYLKVKNNSIKFEQAKDYYVDSTIKPHTLLRTEANAKNLRICIIPNENTPEFSIDTIAIDNSFNFNPLRLFLLFSTGIVILFLIFFRKLASEKLHVTFLVIIILIGTNISLFTPPYFSFDEKEHFIRAYQISRADLGIQSNKSINWFNNTDNFFVFNGRSTHYDTYKERIEYTNKFATTDYSKSAYYHSTAATYTFVPYFVSATGIFIARKIGLPFIYTFYAGRLFSLLFYAIVCFFAIKYVKIAKRLIFLIAILPALIYIAGSYSADTTTLAFSIAAVAIFINMLSAKENSIDFKKPLLFLLSVSIATMSKVPYAPICLLILPISNAKFVTKTKALIYKIGVLMATGSIAALTYLYANLRGMNQWQMPGVNIKEQISFIFNHIFEYCYIMINSFAANIGIYFSGITTSLAYSGNLKEIFLYLLIIVLFIIAIIDNESYTLKIRPIDKIFLFLSFAASWGLVITSLYISFTPVASTYIAGVQGRYLAPLLLPILLLFKNSKITMNIKKENLNYLLSIGSCLLLLITASILLIKFNY